MLNKNGAVQGCALTVLVSSESTRVFGRKSLMSSKVETATDVPRAVAFPWRDLNSTGSAHDTPHFCLPHRLSGLVSICE
jgi:hypothetical protein